MSKITGTYTRGVQTRKITFVKGQTYTVTANATHDYRLQGHKNAREYVSRLDRYGYQRQS